MINPQISWYEKHRPVTIDDMVFSNAQQKNLVKSWIDNEAIPGNILLSGPAGTGKTTISTILIRKIIKNQADLCRIKTRSVSDVDEKIAPFVVKRPVSSKCKIVYIEEIDRTSRQFQAQLKEDLMEKYQEYVSFICCTNHPKKIDSALRTRFTFQIEFKSDNVNDIKNRLEYILNSEKVKFNQQELAEFVSKNYKTGLRDLINALQVSYVSNEGIVNFNNLEQNINIEDNIVKYVIEMLEKIMSTTDLTARKLCLSNPFNSIIAKEYSSFVTLCHNNFDINYENIFEKLYDTIKFLPLQVIIGKYSEEIDLKKYPHIHFISGFYEMMKCSLECTL
ncbi:MAG: AAA family ATPase [Candidatus Caldatribacteriota bacterium]